MVDVRSSNLRVPTFLLPMHLAADGARAGLRIVQLVADGRSVGASACLALLRH